LKKIRGAPWEISPSKILLKIEGKSEPVFFLWDAGKCLQRLIIFRASLNYSGQTP